MSFNGSGTFVINTSGQPVVPNTVISATTFNALTNDLANGLSTCITKDGQTTPTANIPMGNNKITGLAPGTSGTDAANLSQVQSSAAKLLQSVTGTDTITAAMVPALTSYSAGQMFYFVAAGDNTGAVTINIDSLGAKSVTRDGSTALVAGDIVSGEVALIVYDGTRFQLLNGNSFTNLNVSNNLTLSGGTANGVLYLNGSKVATSGSALVFDGTNLGIGTSSPATKLHVNTGAAGYAITVAALSQTSITYQLGIDSNSNLAFYDTSAAAQRLVLSTSGNLGLGVTPSAWSGGGVARAIQIGSYGAGLFSNAGGDTLSTLTHGAYFDGTNWKYLATSVGAGRYEITGANAGSVHSWSTSAGGTAGNIISFTQAMTLDASGNLGIGTSLPAVKFVVSNAGANGFEFDPTTGIAQTYNRSGAAYTSYKIYGLDLEFRAGASPAVAMTIDSNRNIVAGASAALATTATNGFLYVPTCAGTPTGTPTTITGMAPIVVNTTNNKLYFYSGGSWRDAGP
jgi:hypothetical protein